MPCECFTITYFTNEEFGFLVLQYRTVILVSEFSLLYRPQKVPNNAFLNWYPSCMVCEKQFTDCFSGQTEVLVGEEKEKPVRNSFNCTLLRHNSFILFFLIF